MPQNRRVRSIRLLRPVLLASGNELSKDIEVLDEAGQARWLAPLIFLMDRVLISQQLARLLHEREYLVGKILRAVLVRLLLFKKFLH